MRRIKILPRKGIYVIICSRSDLVYFIRLRLSRTNSNPRRNRNPLSVSRHIASGGILLPGFSMFCTRFFGRKRWSFLVSMGKEDSLPQQLKEIDVFSCNLCACVDSLVSDFMK
ncbi:unnamed protein product [Musa acuminata subsp. burmannicoides]